MSTKPQLFNDTTVEKCYFGVMHDVLVLSELTLGAKVRLARLSKKLRQVDLASLAGYGVTPADVSTLEKDRWLAVKPTIKILKALGFDDEADALLPRKHENA